MHPHPRSIPGQPHPARPVGQSRLACEAANPSPTFRRTLAICGLLRFGLACPRPLSVRADVAASRAHITRRRAAAGQQLDSPVRHIDARWGTQRNQLAAGTRALVNCLPASRKHAGPGLVLSGISCAGTRLARGRRTECSARSRFSADPGCRGHRRGPWIGPSRASACSGKGFFGPGGSPPICKTWWCESRRQGSQPIRLMPMPDHSFSDSEPRGRLFPALPAGGRYAMLCLQPSALLAAPGDVLRGGRVVPSEFSQPCGDISSLSLPGRPVVPCRRAWPPCQ
jgi:hypothetical protein